MENLKQEEISISEYTSKFNKLVKRISIEEKRKHFEKETLMNTYIQGLNKKIAKKVIEEDPENLNKAIKIAKKKERGLNYQKERNVDEVVEEIEREIRKQVEKSKEKETKDEMDELTEKFAQIGIKFIMQTNGRKDIKCYKCNRYEHIARNCNESLGRTKREVVQYKNCNKLGHESKNCYKNRTCGKCGTRGHTEEICGRNIRIAQVKYKNASSSESESESDDEKEIPGILVTLRSGKRIFQPSQDVKEKEKKRKSLTINQKVN